jgi:hypothetical protein
MTILHYAYGDLKILINELDIEELTSDYSGETVFKHIHNSYSEYFHRKLPKAMEQSIFDDKANRHSGESMLQFTSRKRALLKKLDKAECKLPSTAKGYLLLRGAKLSDRAWDMVETWLQGNYEENDVIDALKKLERPVPGRAGATHLCGFVDDEDPAMHTRNDEGGVFFGQTSDGNVSSGLSEGSSLVFMTESLFLIPECFDDEEVLAEVAKYIDDPDILFVAGDLGEDLEFTEDEAISILANYGQVRSFLHKKVLGRGFNRPNKPGPSGQRPRRPPPRPPKANAARPKKWSKKFLISKSICARCGQKGHWARHCKNPPDERGKMRMSGNHFLAIADSSESVSQSLEDSAIHYNMDQPIAVEEAPFSPEELDIVGEAEISLLYPLYTSIFPEGIGTFIGLTIAPGFALVDTGAQHGVLGPTSYKQVEDRLSVHGLKPRIVETLQLLAAGVGGSTKFILSAEIPIALQGTCGVLTIHVVEQELPLLLPVGFCRGLGMILNTPKMQIYWENIKKTSELHDVGNGEHFAIEIFEFPKTGWKCPHEQSNPKQIVAGSGRKVDKRITRKDYELPNVPSSSFGSKPGIRNLSLFGETDTDVGTASMPTPRFGKLDELQSAAEGCPDPRAGPGAKATTGKVESGDTQTPHGTGNLCPQKPHPSSAGNRRLQTHLPQGSRGRSPVRNPAAPASHDQRRIDRKTPEGGRRSSDCGSADVQSSYVRNEAPRKQDQVVDLQSVQEQVGAHHPGVPTRNSDGQGTDALRSTPRAKPSSTSGRPSTSTRTGSA